MSEPATKFDYLRVTISGILTCKSDLHIGDGDLTLMSERDRDKTHPDETGSFNSVCVDNNKQAYIPASSLRGSLHAFLEEGNNTVEKLFGYEKPGDDQKKGERRAGKMRLHDARIYHPLPKAEADNLPYWSNQRKTFLNHGIGINPVTGTVAKGKLFRHEFVPAKTCFRVTLEADELTQTELEQLLGLLNRWNGDASSAMGHATSKGYGRVSWQLDQKGGIKVLTLDQLKKWAKNNTPNDAPVFEPITLQPTDITSLTKSRDRLPFTLHIRPKSPLLCHEPGFIPKGDKAKDGDAKIIFNKRNNKAIIPAPTLAGMARARGRKILLTLLYQADPNPQNLEELSHSAETLIGQIFGSKDRQSIIEFSDATDVANETKEHRQFFNAIDRFTGGVKGTALLNVKAAVCNELVTKTCWLDMDRAPAGDWWKGLLLFIARDALEGDLAIGWGKAKGYGTFNGYIEHNDPAATHWNELLDTVNRDKAEQWIDALLKKISNTVTAEKGERT